VLGLEEDLYETDHGASGALMYTGRTTNQFVFYLNGLVRRKILYHLSVSFFDAIMEKEANAVAFKQCVFWLVLGTTCLGDLFRSKQLSKAISLISGF
jgi:hypothetical protein